MAPTTKLTLRFRFVCGLVCLAAALPAQNRSTDLSRLAAGVQAYERKDYAAAIASLQGLETRLPKLADYAAYYRAAAEVESKTGGDVTPELAPVWSAPVASPLAAKAAIVASSGLISAGQPADAARVLTLHYDRLPQPDGDMAMAFAYESAAELPRAVTYYQQVYFRYPATDAAQNAAIALSSLQNRLGAAYTAAPARMSFERARRLMDAKQYARTHAEFEALLGALTGSERDAARLALGTSDYLRGQVSGACQYLRTLELTDAEAEAERLYYAAECAGRSGDEAARTEIVARLGREHAASRWRYLALMSLANRFLLSNRIDEYEPLYAAVAKTFPAESRAPQAHWRYAWASYIQRKPDAAERLREHLRLFPGQPSAAAALYFLGRAEEQAGDYGSARACYTKLTGQFANYYYAVLGRERLADTHVAGAPESAATRQWLSSIAFAPRRYTGAIEPDAQTQLRLERASALRSAGLNELADGELRFGARNGAQATLLAIELARTAGSAYIGLRAMKAFVPDSLGMPLDGAPTDFWQFLFPLPYKNDVVKNAQANSLDPYLVAALIRQESEFNPRALSRAKAYGLTQVLPVTGRSLARKIGLRNFSSGMLYQPATNLRLGTLYLRMLLDEFGGSWEETLASYNAGKTHVKQWRTWADWREPAEFVESIPFTETREYVQAVIRNADLYRKIYAARR